MHGCHLKAIHGTPSLRGNTVAETFGLKNSPSVIKLFSSSYFSSARARQRIRESLNYLVLLEAFLTVILANR